MGVGRDGARDACDEVAPPIAHATRDKTQRPGRGRGSKHSPPPDTHRLQSEGSSCLAVGRSLRAAQAHHPLPEPIQRGALTLRGGMGTTQGLALLPPLCPARGGGVHGGCGASASLPTRAWRGQAAGMAGGSSQWATLGWSTMAWPLALLSVLLAAPRHGTPAGSGGWGRGSGAAVESGGGMQTVAARPAIVGCRGVRRS